jgi:ABC-type transporter lipoprotein component MlaA
MAYVTVDVDVDLSDIDTVDLVEELESRGGTELSISDDLYTIIRNLYEKRRTGKDYQTELDQLIFSVLGKII